MGGFGAWAAAYLAPELYTAMPRGRQDMRMRYMLHIGSNPSTFAMNSFEQEFQLHWIWARWVSVLLANVAMLLVIDRVIVCSWARFYPSLGPTQIRQFRSVSKGKWCDLVSRCGVARRSLDGSRWCLSFVYPLVISHSYGKSPCYQWENPLFLWSFSIAMLVITRG